VAKPQYIAVAKQACQICLQRMISMQFRRDSKSRGRAQKPVDDPLPIVWLYNLGADMVKAREMGSIDQWERDQISNPSTPNRIRAND